MSDISLRASGSTTPAPSIVTTDQDTIIGDGTTQSPLQAGPGSSGGTITASYVSVTIPVPLPGQPTRISFGSVGGRLTVSPTDARARSRDNEVVASVAGVIARVDGDGVVQFQTSGLLELTTAEWDAVTGDVGGLVLGHTYYASADDLGTITDDVPVDPGQFVSRIGFALGGTTMLVMPEKPTQNLADFIIFVTFATSDLIIGSAVAVPITGAGRRIEAAISNGTITDAQAIGIVVGLDAEGDPIVQTGGVVTLTTAQWDAVTNTIPGMQAGTAYYVDTSANPGHLTAVAPLSGFKTQIGVGLSTTEMVLPAPFPLRF